MQKIQPRRRGAHASALLRLFNLAGAITGLTRVARLWMLMAVMGFASIPTAWAAAPVLIPPDDTAIIEDSGRTNLIFLVTDEDTPFFTITVTARSSNTNLVPLANLAVIGAGTTREVGITPKPNASGSSTISLIASDGTSSTTNSFLLTVVGVNDGPTITPLPDRTILEDAAPTNLTAIVVDSDSPISLVTLTATSSDPGLIVPSLTGSATNRTLKLTVVSNQFGTATITLLANDGSLKDTNTFSVTVLPVNDLPVISPLAPLTILEDVPTNRTVTVRDVDTDIDDVTVTAESSNTGLANVSVSGTGTNRTLTITPVADAVGTATIRVIASDGAVQKATNSFVLTVAPVNDMPSFTLATSLVTLNEDFGVYRYTNFIASFSNGPTNEAAQTRTYVVTSDNPAFFAVQPTIVSTGLLSFRVATNVFGTNTLSVILRDSGGTNSGGVNTSLPANFTIVVNPLNDPPFLATNAPFVINEDVGSTNKNIMVTDPDTTISAVTVSATISDTNIANVSISGSTTNRTVTVTTLPDVNGSAVITLIADDGVATWTNSFPLIVNPINDRPSFTLVTNLITVAEDSGDFTFPNFATNILSGPPDEAGQTNVFVLTVTNAAFYAVQPTISPSGTLTFRPGLNRVGTNNVRVVLRDNFGTTNGGLNLSLTQQFSVVVTGDNDAPVIAGISDFTVNEDSGRTTRSFSVTDTDDPITNIVLSVFSSDPSVATAAVSGTTTNRTLAVTTATNAFGTTTITLVAEDGSAATTNSLVLTVAPVNDPPVVTSLTNITVLEDSAPVAREIMLTDIDTAIGDIVLTAISSATNVATASTSGTTTNRTITVTPATNGVGTATITYIANDGTRTATNSFTVTVTPVNDPPTFTLATNTVVVVEDSPTRTIVGFATAITRGPSNESSQAGAFTVTTTNTSFFALQPTISAAGVLSFRPATNATGTNQITVVLTDNGGTNNGGINQSAPQTFNIVVTEINDAPVLSGLSSFSINEDQSTNVTFTVEDVDTPLNSVTVAASSSNTNLVTVGTTGTSTNRTLDITPAQDLSGSATITLVTSDGAISRTNSIILTINSANDAPSFTLTTNVITLGEDSGPFTLAGLATNIVAGPTNESGQTVEFVLTVTNSAFFSAQPVLNTNGTITFTPATNVYGTNVILVQLQDNGGTNNSGVDISEPETLTIIVNGTNDAPVISGLVSLTIDEDSGETERTFLVEDTDTDISSVVVTAESSDTDIITVAVSGTDTNRTLTITTVTNGAGSVTITLVADDGSATTTNIVSVIVSGTNDIPVMDVLTDLVVLEDAAPVNRTVVVNDGDDAITNVVVTAVSSDTNIVTVSITGANNNRTLTVSPVTNAVGNVTITLVANDGTDTSTNQFEFTITPVNDAPVFTVSTNIVNLAEDAGSQVMTNFLTGIAPGPSDESDQTNYFMVTTTNTAFFAVQPAISVDGTLTFTVATNTFGTNQISIVAYDDGGTDDGGSDASAAATVDIVVASVNDAPAIISGHTDFTVREDTGTFNRDLVVVDVDGEITNVVITATSADTNVALVSISGTSSNRTLVVTTVTNVFGATTVTLVSTDGSDSSTNELLLTISSVNDQPTFGLSTNLVTVLEDSGPFSMNNLATNIVLGPANESSQTNFFILIQSNPGLYATLPEISPTGTLTFEPGPGASGTDNIQVYLRDSGGATNTGVNTSIAHLLTISIVATNDAPVITGLAPLTVSEDSGSTNLAFTISDQDTDVSAIVVTATSSDTDVATVLVSGSGASRTLEISPVADGFGTSTLSVVANDGVNATTNTLLLTVTGVNDAPTLSTLTNITVLEDSGPVDLPIIAADVDHDFTNLVLNAVSSDTNVATASISGPSTNLVLTVNPTTNGFGTATISFSVSDGSLGVTNSFVVNVTSVNDAPLFTLSTNRVTVMEDVGLVTLTAFVTDIADGPANESSQTNFFVVTAADTSFFTNQPAISPSGTLTFRVNTNKFGTNLITVVLRDNGGTNNGGINESAQQSFEIVVEDANDLPILGTLANLTIREDGGATNRTFTVRDIDTDIASVVVMATSSDTNLVSLLVSGTSTNRTLTITPLPDAYGTATIRLIANDGSDTVTNSFTLTVSPVNDAPSFTLSSSNVDVAQFSTLTTVSNFVQNIVAGPDNESAQTMSFTVTAATPGFFVVLPTISANGTLKFQAKDAAGTTTVTVRLQDNGGTAFGGSNTAPAQTFTITVPANPFSVLAGSFNGLFYDENGVEMESAGFMNFTLTTNGAYNGYVLLAGASNTFSGRFFIDGTATNSITTSNGPVDVAMTLDLSPAFTESATGTLTHSNWTSTLIVDRSTFDATTNPSFQAGYYNVAFPGSVDPSMPEGFGFGLVTVHANGTVDLNGQLGDGTQVAQVTKLSRNGTWPFYASLYAGKGMVLGWINFAYDGVGDLSGATTWIKEPGVDAIYPNGFTNDFTTTGSTYVEPETGGPALSFTGGTVYLTGGDLSSPIVTSITLNADNSVTVDPLDPNALTISIDVPNGTFTGSFIHPDLGLPVTFDGVLLQTSNKAVGHFVTPDKSGAVILQ